MSEKYQWFNGIKFTRDDKTGYYLNSTIRERLHRYVWKFNNGEIPKGYHVHHKDHNKDNNVISNLELKIHSKHIAQHGIERDKTNHDWLVKNLEEKARPAACLWHKSEEGRKWHKAQWHNSLGLVEKKKHICEYCGNEFETIPKKSNRFCSNKCKSAWRRKAGVDDETRRCACCGKEFRVNKYSNTKCCSNSCANRLFPRLPQLRKNKKD